jgi:hypothetical protein
MYKMKITAIISWILTALLWAIIWIVTDIKITEWRFWAVLFAIIMMIILNDVRKDLTK